MKKTLIPLLALAFVFSVVVTPVAMADHCRKCNTAGTRCVIAVNGGKPSCDDSSGTCVLTGLTCTGPHPLLEDDDDALASKFVVASVERLDEAQPAADATRVASLGAPQPDATR